MKAIQITAICPICHRPLVLCPHTVTKSGSKLTLKETACSRSIHIYTKSR